METPSGPETETAENEGHEERLLPRNDPGISAGTGRSSSRDGARSQRRTSKDGSARSSIDTFREGGNDVDSTQCVPSAVGDGGSKGGEAGSGGPGESKRPSSRDPPEAVPAKNEVSTAN